MVVGCPPAAPLKEAGVLTVLQPPSCARPGWAGGETGVSRPHRPLSCGTPETTTMLTALLPGRRAGTTCCFPSRFFTTSAFSFKVFCRTPEPVLPSRAPLVSQPASVLVAAIPLLHQLRVGPSLISHSSLELPVVCGGG